MPTLLAPAGRRSRALVAAAIAAAALLAVVYVVAVQTTRGQRIDDRAVLGGYVVDRAYDDVDLLLSSISVASVVLIGGAIALTALLRRRPALALGALAVIGLSVGTTELLKLVLLPRPRLHVSAVLPQPSFPSGHATVAMALALAAVVAAPYAARTTVALLGLVYALAIGVGVLTAGWHRPSDVLGSQLVTFAWTAIVCAVLVRRSSARGSQHEERADASRRQPPAVALLAVGTGLLALAMLAAAGIVLERRHGGFERFGPGWDYAVAVVVIVGLGTALVALLLWLLRGVSLDSRAPPPGSRSASPGA